MSVSASNVYGNVSAGGVSEWPKPGVRGDDADVGAQRDLQPAAERVAAHRGDHRDR